MGHGSEPAQVAIPPVVERVEPRGLGARLVGRSEEAARAWGMDRLAVMAGMGARGYFRRLGYSLEGPYMVSPKL